MSLYFADRDRIKRDVLRVAEAHGIEAWWRAKHKDTRHYKDRTTGGMLREYYFDLAIEVVQLRQRMEDGGDVEEFGDRLTELEDVFSDGKGGSSEEWIASQLDKLGSEVKEYEFHDGPGNESQDQRRHDGSGEDR